MKKILNILTMTSLIFGTPAAINNTLDSYKKESTNSSFTLSINYKANWQLSASWSRTERKNDEKEYKLFNLLTYANNPIGFFAKYPTITLKTEGHAISQSTFGDVGKNKFGYNTFLTSEFFKSDISYKYMVDASDSKTAAYTIAVNIGVGFQTKNNILCLYPTIYGRITSVGAYTRSLDFGFDLYSITFNSRN